MGKHRLTVYPTAGYLSFLFEPEFQPRQPSTGDNARLKPAKLARFLHVLGVKNGYKCTQNSLIMVINGLAKNTYHDHLFTIPQKVSNIHYLQMINDLQRRFENADNFSVV